MEYCAHGKMMGCPTCHADGGEIKEMGDESFNKEEMASGYVDEIVDRVLAKMDGYSEGGEVANDTGDGESADMKENQFDDLVLDGGMEGHYPGSQEIGDDQEDMDREDVVKRALRSLAKKDRMPRPA